MKKLNVFFILPNVFGDTTLGTLSAATSPPTGLAFLASMILREGHNVDAADLRVETEYEMHEKIKNFNPDYMCVSFMSFGYKQIYNFIDRMKEKYPKIPIVIGGPHASLFLKQALEESKVDFAVYGEGELTLAELLSGKNLKDIKGLVWRNGNDIVVNMPREFNENLDDLPFPKFDLFPLDRYTDKKIPIVSSRGCPHSCIFCEIPKFAGKKLRHRSAKNVVDEMEYWYEKGYNYFPFVDDNVAQDTNKFIELCDEIIRRGIKIKWDLRNGIRVDKVNYDLLMKMKEAGCIYFVLSVEHFDDEVLRTMKKGITSNMVFKAIEDSEKAGIPFGITIIVGLPGDTFEKFMRNYKLVQKYNFEEVRFYNALSYPGTELHQMILDKGNYLMQPEEFLSQTTIMGDEPLFEYPGFTIEEKKKALKMGENLLMKKIIKKEFGSVLGAIGYGFWRIESLRQPVTKIGTGLWKSFRKLKSNLNLS